MSARYKDRWRRRHTVNPLIIIIRGVVSEPVAAVARAALRYYVTALYDIDARARARRRRRPEQGRRDKVASPRLPSLLSVLGGPLTRHAYKAVFIAVVYRDGPCPDLYPGREKSSKYSFRSRNIIVPSNGKVSPSLLR